MSTVGRRGIEPSCEDDTIIKLFKLNNFCRQKLDVMALRVPRPATCELAWRRRDPREKRKTEKTDNAHRRTVAPAAYELQQAWSVEPPLDWNSLPLMRQRSAMVWHRAACGTAAALARGESLHVRDAQHGQPTLLRMCTRQMGVYSGLPGPGAMARAPQGLLPPGLVFSACGNTLGRPGGAAAGASMAR